jgi:DNA-binding transcriptional ArsR family regulator
MPTKSRSCSCAAKRIGEQKAGRENFVLRETKRVVIRSVSDGISVVPALRARQPRATPKYALTSICAVEYIQGVESIFEIIAEPNRRAILSLLASSEQSVGEIERQLRMPQTTVSKHLRVLRESTVDAQRRLYRLKPEPLQELDAWLAQFRRFWSAHIDALERHLDRMDRDRMHPPKSPKSPTAKTKENTTRPKPQNDKGETK